MYREFYHLGEDPFRLSPDYRYCFRHRSYAKSKAYMRYAIDRGEGFAMITGSAGTGKTTLSQDLINGLDPDQVAIGQLVSTRLSADDLLRMVAFAFGVEVEGVEKATVLRRLEQYLKNLNAGGKRAVLIIDEAQDLSEGALEELRLLTNLQLESRHLVQVVLLGQERLRDIVRAPAMEQLHQRFIAASNLEPLDANETRDYVHHRLRFAGWEGDPAFGDDTCEAIYELARGIPRRINLVCSRLLLHGCAHEKHVLERNDVIAVAEELRNETLAPADEPLPADPYAIDDRPPLVPAAHGTTAAPPSASDLGPEPTVPLQDGFSADTSRSRPAELPEFSARGSGPAVPLPEAAELPPIAIETEEPPLAKPKRTGTGIYAAAAGILLLLVLALYAVDPRVIGPIAADMRSWLIQTFPGLRESLTPSPGEPLQPQNTLPLTVPPDRRGASATVAPVETRNDRASGEAPTAAQPVTPRTAFQRPTPPTPEVSPTLAPTPASPPAPQTAAEAPLADISEDEQAPAAEALPPPAAGRDGPAASVTDRSTQETSDQATINPATTAHNAPAEFQRMLASRGLRVATNPELQREVGQIASVRRLDDGTLAVALSGAQTFNTGSAYIRPTFRPILEGLASVFARHGQSLIRLVGHTDNTGNEEVNRSVSRQRADAVAEYLIRKGISRRRLYTEGRGSAQPRASNNTRAGRQLNRRVEIYVTPVAGTNSP